MFVQYAEQSKITIFVSREFLTVFPYEGYQYFNHQLEVACLTLFHPPPHMFVRYVEQSEITIFVSKEFFNCISL